MNTRSTTLLISLAMGFALSASPTMAATQIKEVSGLKMEVDVVDQQGGRKAPRAARSTKPKEIVVVGSKATKSRVPQMAAWHELVILGDVAATRK